MTEALTTGQLWMRVQTGDKEAFAAVYDRLAPSLAGMLVRILHDRDAAEQVLGSVFERLWARAGQPAQPGWDQGGLAVKMSMITRRAAINWLREQGSLPRLDDAQFGSLMFSPGCVPSDKDAASLDERRELLKRVIKQLPESQRSAIDMVVFEGYTETEIAAQLGMPLGRAKAEVRAAMRFLRHRLHAVMGTWASNI